MTVSRARAERGLRGYSRQRRQWDDSVHWGDIAVTSGAMGGSFGLQTTHRYRREGDEMACNCGARWSIVGEEHP